MKENQKVSNKQESEKAAKKPQAVITIRPDYTSSLIKIHILLPKEVRDVYGLKRRNKVMYLPGDTSDGKYLYTLLDDEIFSLFFKKETEKYMTKFITLVGVTSDYFSQFMNENTIRVYKVLYQELMASKLGDDEYNQLHSYSFGVIPPRYHLSKDVLDKCKEYLESGNNVFEMDGKIYTISITKANHIFPIIHVDTEEIINGEKGVCIPLLSTRFICIDCNADNEYTLVQSSVSLRFKEPAKEELKINVCINWDIVRNIIDSIMEDYYVE